MNNLLFLGGIAIVIILGGTLFVYGAITLVKIIQKHLQSNNKN